MPNSLETENLLTAFQQHSNSHGDEAEVSVVVENTVSLLVLSEIFVAASLQPPCIYCFKTAFEHARLESCPSWLTR
jgi:hypothetical protein